MSHIRHAKMECVCLNDCKEDVCMRPCVSNQGAENVSIYSLEDLSCECGLFRVHLLNI